MPRKSDPGLEAEQLSQLMLALAGLPDANLADVTNKPEDAQKAAIPSAATTRPTGGTGPNGASRARLIAGQPGATLQVDDNFDRSWRRIGLALDHGGFTVEDRDRAQGLYYVRYVDPKTDDKDRPGFITRIFSSDDKSKLAEQYRIVVKTQTGGSASRIQVQNKDGAPEAGDAGTRILALLNDQLK